MICFGNSLVGYRDHSTCTGLRCFVVTPRTVTNGSGHSLERLRLREAIRGVVVLEFLAIPCVDLVLDIRELSTIDVVQRLVFPIVSSQFVVKVIVHDTFL